jgi:hypothetical protein
VKKIVFFIWPVIIFACSTNNQKGNGYMFGEDLEFLKKHTEVVVLEDKAGTAQVAVCPELQGRIMTSTANGLDGLSYGWINHQFIESGENNQHFNPYGGEDRFWLGPEGGQFSLYFKQGDEFNLDNWYTPAPTNEIAYEAIVKEKNQIVFRTNMNVENYSSHKFNLELTRKVVILEKSDLSEFLSLPSAEANMVAYQSVNTVKNTGQTKWDKSTGLLSIWILGMFNPSPATTIVIPVKPGLEKELGPIVNDAYFGKVPANRLVVKEDVLFFSGDGQYRSKIGITPQRAKPIMGSYDADNKVLTLVHFTLLDGVTDYVNSMWEIQDQPFSGDAANSYNDGPPEPGVGSLGPFYELESSSPAMLLGPDESQSHTHTTIHFQGETDELDKIAQATLGVTINEITNALK